jgi:TPR repeat protein
MKKSIFIIFASISFSLFISHSTWADPDTADSQSTIYSLTRKADAGDKGALNELQKIGASGNMLAQYHLGLYYAYKEEQTALKWFRLAADQGHCISFVYLGSLYRDTSLVLSLAIEKVAINNAEQSGNSDDLYYVRNPKANWPLRYQELTKDQQVTTNKLTEEMQKPNNFLKALDTYLLKK